MEYKTIIVEEKGEGIVSITLNRPERLNAINFEMIEELLNVLSSLETRYDARVVLLTGSGRAFSAGLDLKDASVVASTKVPEEFQKFKHLQTKDKTKRMLIGQHLMGQVITRLRQIPQPIIAAIKGHCYGAGFGMTLASDIRVAGESAIFCNAFVKIGVSGADCGSSYWLPRILGFSRAAEMMYTGRDVPASEAAQIGLVSKVVPDAEVLDAALAIARNILNCSPLGIRCTKEALNANVNAPSLETAIQFENRTQVLCLTTKDANEGVLSFIEKRKPKYGEW